MRSLSTSGKVTSSKAIKPGKFKSLEFKLGGVALVLVLFAKYY